MKLTSLFLGLTACALTFAACNRDDEGTAGKGGSASLRVYPLHHGISVDSVITVYVKYNTQDKPANNIYDDSVKTVNLGASLPRMALFPGLKKGNYYFFGHGWDPAISQPVEGGMPYTLTTDNKQVDINLPVTEGD